jgi:hypothetical protein
MPPFGACVVDAWGWSRVVTQRSAGGPVRPGFAPPDDVPQPPRRQAAPPWAGVSPRPLTAVGSWAAGVARGGRVAAFDDHDPPGIDNIRRGCHAVVAGIDGGRGHEGHGAVDPAQVPPVPPGPGGGLSCLLKGHFGPGRTRVFQLLLSHVGDKVGQGCRIWQDERQQRVNLRPSHASRACGRRSRTPPRCPGASCRDVFQVRRTVASRAVSNPPVQGGVEPPGPRLAVRPRDHSGHHGRYGGQDVPAHRFPRLGHTEPPPARPVPVVRDVGRPDHAEHRPARRGLHRSSASERAARRGSPGG